MRGKVEQREQMQISIRITPAYAGKSFPKNRINIVVKDHPRLCGEKWSTPHTIPVDRGSPPPMRGKVQRIEKSKFAFRITPAYAGKSNSFFAISSACRDHPRLCGEKTVKMLEVSLILGSPPPMRGKVHRRTIHKRPERITPAYAGKSWQSMARK